MPQKVVKILMEKCLWNNFTFNWKNKPQKLFKDYKKNYYVKNVKLKLIKAK